jgi:hypothetical protein
VAAADDVEPVDHHRRKANVFETPAHQLSQRRLGALDEGARDRRARR